MAGRKSSSITAGTAQNIFENTGSGPVVVSINAVSSDNTVNPKLSLLIDNSSTRSLNFLSVAKTLVGPVTENTGDFDLKSGSNGVTRLQNVVGNGKKRLGVNGTSYTSAYWGYTQYDNYFLTKPSAYNKTSAYGGITIGDAVYFYGDISADKSYFPTWLSGSTTSGSSYISGNTYSYSGSFLIYDIWTDTAISINTSGYMTGGQYYDYNGSSVNHDSANRTSDGFQYSGLAGSDNPDNFKIDDGKTLDAQCDGGVYVFATGNNKNASNSKTVGFISARQWRNNGTYTAGASTIKNAKDTTTSQNENTLISTSQLWHSRLNFDLSTGGSHSLSWIKYNPTTDKYYLNVQSSSSNNGVWSFGHEDIFTSGYTLVDFNTVCAKESATYPLTVKTSQPERIGASLWVVYTSNTQGDALYSTDLINWKTASEMGYPSATLLAVDHSGSSEKILFLKSTEQDKLFKKETGFSSIPQTGLLENGSSIGTYERNGLVLDPGDCIYAENQDAATTVHATVTFMEV